MMFLSQRADVSVLWEHVMCCTALSKPFHMMYHWYGFLMKKMNIKPAYSYPTRSRTLVWSSIKKSWVIQRFYWVLVSDLMWGLILIKITSAGAVIGIYQHTTLENDILKTARLLTNTQTDKWSWLHAPSLQGRTKGRTKQPNREHLVINKTPI